MVKRIRKRHIDHWQESRLNFVFDNKMNGTQLIKNLSWIGRTNDLIEKMELEEEEDISESENDNDDGEQLKKSNK